MGRSRTAAASVDLCSASSAGSSWNGVSSITAPSQPRVRMRSSPPPRDRRPRSSSCCRSSRSVGASCPVATSRFSMVAIRPSSRRIASFSKACNAAVTTVSHWDARRDRFTKTASLTLRAKCRSTTPLTSPMAPGATGSPRCDRRSSPRAHPAIVDRPRGAPVRSCATGPQAFRGSAPTAGCGSPPALATAGGSPAAAAPRTRSGALGNLRHLVGQPRIEPRVEVLRRRREATNPGGVLLI